MLEKSPVSLSVPGSAGSQHIEEGGLKREDRELGAIQSSQSYCTPGRTTALTMAALHKGSAHAAASVGKLAEVF